MGLKFHWSIYVFFPPITIGKTLGWPVIVLALAVATTWLWLGGRTLDVVLLGLAVIAVAAVTWWVVHESAGRKGLASAGDMAIVASAHFIWFALILLPVRWLARCFHGA